MAKYIDREALIDWLKRIPIIDLSDGRGICRVIMEDDFKKAIKKMPKGIIADVEPVQEWISVEDKLPEVVSIHKGYRSTVKKSIRVLCVCVQKSGKTMVKEGYCEWYNDYQEPRWQIPGTIDEVTHWQYLPQPPKGE